MVQGHQDQLTTWAAAKAPNGGLRRRLTVLACIVGAAAVLGATAPRVHAETLPLTGAGAAACPSCVNDPYIGARAINAHTLAVKLARGEAAGGVFTPPDTTGFPPEWQAANLENQWRAQAEADLRRMNTVAKQAATAAQRRSRLGLVLNSLSKAGKWTTRLANPTMILATANAIVWKRVGDLIFGASAPAAPYITPPPATAWHVANVQLQVNPPLTCWAGTPSACASSGWPTGQYLQWDWRDDANALMASNQRFYDTFQNGDRCSGGLSPTPVEGTTDLLNRSQSACTSATVLNGTNWGLRHVYFTDVQEVDEDGEAKAYNPVEDGAKLPGTYTPPAATVTRPTIAADITNTVVTLPETGEIIQEALNPDELVIPVPLFGETYPQYLARLQTLGYVGTATEVVLTDATLDAQAGPDAVVTTSPAPGTTIDPADSIKVKVNPPSAPEPGSVSGGGGGGCDPWLSPAIDLSPLDVPIGDVFPFAVPAWVGDLMGSWIITGGEAPSWSLKMPFTDPDDPANVVSLDIFDPWMPIWRGTILAVSIVLMGMSFMGLALGKGDD